MGNVIFTSLSPEDTINLGAKLGEKLKPGAFLILTGELGSGKTTFIKGIAKALDINIPITSPSFLIIKEYEGKYPFIHVDAYRLTSPLELINIGWEEYLNGTKIIAVEWGEKILEICPEEYLQITFFHEELNIRKIIFKANGEKYEELLRELNI